MCSIGEVTLTKYFLIEPFRYGNNKYDQDMVGDSKNDMILLNTDQGRIQDLKLGGALKIIAPSEARRENVLGISS